jgi:hypothetical protein
MALSQRQRSLTNLTILFTVMVALGLIAYYGVFKRDEQEKKIKEAKEKVFDFDKTKATGLVVFAKDATTELSKEGDTWKITSPIKTDADKSTVDSLIDRLLSMKQKTTVDDRDLEKYGLKNPKIRINLKVEGSPDVKLAVGEDNDFDGSTYVQTGTSPDVIQAEGGLKWALEKNTFDLRDKRVMSFEDKDVKAISVTAPKLTYSLEKADNKWKLVTPVAMAAEETAVNRILSGLRNLRATAFEEDAKDLSKYGLDKPVASAVITLATGDARQSVLIGQTGSGSSKKTYAKRGEAPWVAEVAASVIEDLDKPLSDLRDKTVLAFDRDKVSAVKFTSGATTIQMEKHPATTDGGTEEWVETAPHQSLAKKWKMSNVLWTLSSMKAASFADEHPTDLAKYGLDKPSRTVTVVGDDGKEIGTIQFGKENGGNVYATSSANPQVVEVEKNRLNELPSQPQDVEETPPPSTDAGPKAAGKSG